jgi:xanthine dehydrogenase YagS FAD-binding subunit
MNKFSLVKPSTVEEARDQYDGSNVSRFIAGGTNLIDLMRVNVERPHHLIDINGLDLHQISQSENGGLLLGALAKNSDTAYHPLVQEQYPLLAKAILAGASPQLRNMATNGGNLLQRTRCYYFYDSATPCNKRVPGQGCSALKGFNRIHAILGTSEHCIATHPSDMCIALAALEARIHIEGDSGKRIIPFEDFHKLPGDTPHIDTSLKPGELVTHIELPPGNLNKHYQYIKVRDRRSYAFALISVAVALELNGSRINRCRIAIGGVAHKPWRDREAEALLEGNYSPDIKIFEEAAALILRPARAFRYNQFKIELTKRAIVRALSEAMESNSTEPLDCYTYNRHRLQPTLL